MSQPGRLQTGVLSGACLLMLVVGLVGCSQSEVISERPRAIPEVEYGGTLAGGSVDPISWQKMVASVSRSAFKVTTLKCDGSPIATGSGFRVGNLIVTNRHVVEGAERIELEGSAGDVLEAKEWYVSQQDDLSLIVPETAMTKAPALETAVEDPVSGDLVASVGYPLGGDLQSRKGRVVGRVDDAPESSKTYLLTTDARALPGDSGGVLVNVRGVVVAVTTALSFEEDATLGIPVSRLTELLSTYRALTPRVACP